jgi:hypothetical protein
LDVAGSLAEDPDLLLSLDELLSRLAEEDDAAARLAHLHLFGGLSVEEAGEEFAVFNPHTTITLDLHGESHCWKATNPEWEKWKPNQPTSAHWYEQRHIERLIGAYITHQRETGTDRLVSDFLSEFDTDRHDQADGGGVDGGLHRISADTVGTAEALGPASGEIGRRPLHS